MKGGNVNDFIDHTTFEDCAVIYKGEKYFFHGVEIEWVFSNNIPLLSNCGGATTNKTYASRHALQR